MRKAVLILTASILSAAITAVCVIKLSKEPPQSGKVVFMDSFEVFENFEMKKDFDKKLNMEISGDQSALDSLGTALTKATNEETVNKLKKEFTEKKLRFDEKYKDLASTYTNKVYEKLNELVSRYGKENHYALILGSNGDGNVMYVDTTNNITADLIRFINKDYLK